MFSRYEIRFQKRTTLTSRLSIRVRARGIELAPDATPNDQPTDVRARSSLRHAVYALLEIVGEPSCELAATSPAT